MNTPYSDDKAALAEFQTDCTAMHAKFWEVYTAAHAQARDDWAQSRAEMAQFEADRIRLEKTHQRWKIATIVASS